MKPFFCYYGGKWRAAPRYPAPTYDRLIEPFAGAAGYSVRYPHLQVELYDTDPAVIGLWRYLIEVSSDDINRLPLEVDHVDDLKVPQEARWLIGFWLNKGASSPRLSPSRWMRDGVRPNSYWGEAVRSRIAQQVEGIRHWKAYCVDYRDAPGVPATWFIDPPYQKSGSHYRNKISDYAELSEWCRTLPGQVIVCEQADADWLPFRSAFPIKSTPGRHGKSVSNEMIWTSDDHSLYEPTA